MCVMQVLSFPFLTVISSQSMLSVGNPSIGPEQLYREDLTGCSNRTDFLIWKLLLEEKRVLYHLLHLGSTLPRFSRDS